ncbi:MAG TPA: flagellar basal-body rod protein FlgF [Terriglobales bacterium]|nr:flagellar basal-body rod protein FlgF [Terriglobales bacterium]
MDSGFYAASAGLKAQSQALEVVAHNLANVNTPGFRGERTTFQSLLALTRAAMANPLNAATNNYGILEGTHLDLSAGTLTNTGNSLDVGIEGSGFFAVHTPQGTRYTRNGSFQVSSTGDLVTQAGDQVLGTTGPIRVPAGPVAISPDGTLSVNGAIAGQIKMVDFPAGTPLVSEGSSLLSAPAASEQAAQNVSLRQGMLETSNVNAITAVTSLIGVQREAEMMGRALTLLDTNMNHVAAAELARV